MEVNYENPHIMLTPKYAVYDLALLGQRPLNKNYLLIFTFLMDKEVS